MFVSFCFKGNEAVRKDSWQALSLQVNFTPLRCEVIFRVPQLSYSYLRLKGIAKVVEITV